MPKFDVGFTFTSEGHMQVEAETLEQAEDIVQEILNKHGYPQGDNVTWDSGEGEVW